MSVEIEHKFLVVAEKLPRQLPAGMKIEQGYLATRPTVRVRLAEKGRSRRAWLTVKGPGFLERAEYEYEIPVRDARALLALCEGRTLTKLRREIRGWELDEFTGRHRGLWLAEYELESRRAALPPLPAWIGAEVTGDPRYSNARLACAGNSRRF
jgi:CYTH domain-containing protein